MAKRIRVNGVLYEAVGPRLPKVSKSSSERLWEDEGDEVRIKFTIGEMGRRKYWDQLDVIGRDQFVPMVRVTASYDPDQENAGFSVSLDDHGDLSSYQGYYRFEKDGVREDDFVRLANDVMSEIAFGLDLDDLDETETFVERKLVRTVSRKLTSAGFDECPFWPED